MPRVKQLKKDKRPKNLGDFPNFNSNGSIKGMKDKYYGKDCLLVRSKGFIYNVTSDPSIYYSLAH